MKRSQLEHLIRAAAGITGAESFVIIGSQAILGQFPEAPGELLHSIEADLVSLRDPADGDLIDGSIGEGSPFHETFGYYGHGVNESIAILPDGWRERLVAIQNTNTGGAVGLCLEVHDLAVAKLAAGRDKDLAFIGGLLRHGLIEPEVIDGRLAAAPVDEKLRALCRARWNGLKG